MTSPAFAIPSPTAFRATLQAFMSSASSFQVLHTHSPRNPPCPPLPVKSLHVLDSSFNPPTRAHLRIATSALADDQSGPCFSKRLLLLLATRNADKPTQPASLEQRLVMMSIFAQDVIRGLGEARTNENGDAPVRVDVGVTKKPYFLDKAAAIDGLENYLAADEMGETLEQVHLIGFDTLLRLLDPKYYPPNRTLRPLDPFFEKCRVIVTKRTGGEWGRTDEQDAYVKALADGMKEEEGGRKEWASRIELIEGRPETETVSSTKVRDAAGRHDHETLCNLVTDGVKRYILDNHLYVDEDR